MKIYNELYVKQNKRGQFAIFQYGKEDPLTVGMTMPEAVTLKSRLDKIQKFRS